MNYDVYHIPVNFTDAGRLFGLFEIRNAIETVLLTVPVLFACIAWLPLELDAQGSGDPDPCGAPGRFRTHRHQRRQPDPVAGLLVALAEAEAADALSRGGAVQMNLKELIFGGGVKDAGGDWRRLPGQHPGLAAHQEHRRRGDCHEGQPFCQGVRGAAGQFLL